MDYYAQSFEAMLMELVRLTGLDKKILKASFKRVHQKHKTSEYTFSIQELDVLPEVNTSLSVQKILQKYFPAIKAFRDMRKKTLHLYDGVKETLGRLRYEGKKIIAYTDAQVFYAVYRLKELGIEELFDGVIATKNFGLPEKPYLEDVQCSGDPEYKTIIPFIKELDTEYMKPDAKCLKSVLKKFSVNPMEVVYIGDSLYKDIYMAQNCGINDVYAEYGRQYNPDNYKLLIEITHWTDEEVTRELKLKTINVSPTFKISRFGELLKVINEIENTRVFKTSSKKEKKENA